MNLRQINRNQKLSNFNYKLIDFISEADEEKVEPKDAFAGMTKSKNPSKKYWYVKILTENIGIALKHPGAGWELADKKKAEAEAEKDIDDKDEDYLQRQMAKEIPDEKETEKAELSPATEPKSAQEIKDFRTTMFGAKPGKSSSWTGRNDQSTPAGDPPSDAMARQTALDLGYPPKGENRGISRVTGQEAAPAPGNAGSMMNEVFSVEGCNIAEEFYEQFGTTPTVEDIENILQQQFGKTQLAEDNGGPSSD